MHVTVHWIENATAGRLGTMSRPRGGDWLEDEIRALQQQGVDVIVSLLEAREISELELEDEPACCASSGLTYLSFPIPDYSVPASREQTRAFVRKLNDFLCEGKNIVIHCRQGIGRSSLLAAAVLVWQGCAVEEAFEIISVARGRAVPDTDAQRAWAASLF